MADKPSGQPAHATHDDPALTEAPVKCLHILCEILD